MLASVVEDVRYEYGRSGGGVSIGYESECSAVVDGYSSALQSGVENVLRNAVQHSPEGSEVQVRLVAEASQAVVTIEDQGGGVAEHELDHIFEPFFRAKTARADETVRGSWLGLAIASRAIALNNGALTACNAEHGLCVEIRLPLDGGPAVLA